MLSSFSHNFHNIWTLIAKTLSLISSKTLISSLAQLYLDTNSLYEEHQTQHRVI